MYRRGTAVGPLAAAFCVLLPAAAVADEGGASVWLPGQFASFAAVPPRAHLRPDDWIAATLVAILVSATAIPGLIL
jgi:hypothetical protein